MAAAHDSDARMDAGEIMFVYGTLKCGGRWHHLLATAEALGDAATTSPYPLLVDDVPYLLDEPGNGNIIEGELYRVDAQTLARLDELEDHPREYRRERRIMMRGSGEPCEAWVYFAHDAALIARLKAMPLAPIGKFDVRSR